MTDLDRLQTFQSLFSQNRFRIPDYQRGYAWGNDQWRELLEDISTLTEENEHFTGLLVLHENEDPSLRIRTLGPVKTVYDIVDGQQRMTTIVLLLNEVRRTMLEIGGEDLEKIAEAICETYLYESGRAGLRVPKLILDGNNHDFFVHNILEMNGKRLHGASMRSHENIQNAQRYFYEYLQRRREELKEAYPVWLEELYGKIISQLKVMVYRLRTDADAGVVFEAMNNRGKKPNQMDLVKNYLLFLASKLPSDERNHLSHEINKTWTTIFEQLNAAGRADDEDTLLEMHWFAAHDHDLKRWAQLGDKSDHVKIRFKPMLIDTSQHKALYQRVGEYVLSLSDASIAFCDLSSPKRSNAFLSFSANRTLRSQVVRISEKLVRLGVLRPFTPLLIAVRLRFKEDSEKYLKIVQLCEKYAFRVFRVANERTNRSEAVLFRLGNQLLSGKMDYQTVLEAVCRDIHARCSDDLFVKSFALDHPKPWYGRSGLSYFLYEYEEYLFGEQEPIVNWVTILGGRSKSVEHILPQNPETEGYWAERFPPEQLERYRHLLGNLTLTEDNSRLGRKPFPEKKGHPGQEQACYFNSNLRVERGLAMFDDWTPSHIERRQQLMAEWAAKRWAVEPPPPLPQLGWDAQLSLARRNGVEAEFLAIRRLAEKLGLGNSPQKRCVSYRPTSNWTKSVITIYTYVDSAWIMLRTENFPHYSRVTPERVQEIMGKRGGYSFSLSQLQAFIARLEQLCREVSAEPEA